PHRRVGQAPLRLDRQASIHDLVEWAVPELRRTPHRILRHDSYPRPPASGLRTDRRVPVSFFYDPPPAPPNPRRWARTGLSQFSGPLLILLANSARGVWRPGFAFPACSSLPKFRPNDPRREFANSIHCYSRPELHRRAVELAERFADGTGRVVEWEK